MLIKMDLKQMIETTVSLTTKLVSQIETNKLSRKEIKDKLEDWSDEFVDPEMKYKNFEQLDKNLDEIQEIIFKYICDKYLIE